MTARKSHSRPSEPAFPALRVEIREAARIIGISRSQIYKRIDDGSLRCQKDGARTFFTLVELERYVESCNEQDNPVRAVGS